MVAVVADAAALPALVEAAPAEVLALLACVAALVALVDAADADVAAFEA